MSDESDPSHPTESQTISLEEALRAQKILRDLAGLEEERFPLPAFVGMISDEIEILRKQGMTDADIAGIVTANTGIKITASQIGSYYASSEERHQPHGQPHS